MKTILNLAAGKLKPLDMPTNNYFLVQLDTMYYHSKEPNDVEKDYEWFRRFGSTNRDETYQVIKCKEDAFKFMERISIEFDRIVAYRFLEHIQMDQVLYFIYLMSTTVKVGCCVDIIVPDYQKLAAMILSEIPGGKGFEAHNILLTTELLNEPGCPHASIWTKDRFSYFFELEGRFKTKKLEQDYEFDGRDIYIRYQAERIK